MAGFNPLKSLENALNNFRKEVLERFDSMQATQKEMQATQKEMQATQKEMQATLNANNEMLHYLVAEVSRFKNESGELMLSAFAFCTIHGVTFTHGDLFTYGGKATRYSRKHGFRIESVQDPRFGAVNLYEAEVLERVILGFTDDDCKV